MPKPTSPTSLVTSIEQVSRLIHASGYAEGLYPAQWAALRYFAEASPASRTTAGLARFQGLTLGSVARTVRTLVVKGLLARQSNPRSRRADLIALTSMGEELLQRDPRALLVSLLDSLPAAHQEALATAVETLLRGLFSERLGGGTAGTIVPRLEGALAPGY